MYLIAQIWWCLLLAFLLGALAGYVLWRACGRRNMLAGFERQKKDLTQRLTGLEHERDRFSAAALDAEKEVARLKEAAALKARVGTAPAGSPRGAHT